MDNSQTELEATTIEQACFFVGSFGQQLPIVLARFWLWCHGDLAKKREVDLFEVRGEIGIIIIETGQLF